MPSSRRNLKFNTLDEVVEDAQTLLDRGYEKTGNWDLAQVCGHLTNWVRYPMEGFPKMPLLLKPVFWVLKNTMAKKLKRQIFAGDGSMKPGMSTAPASVPPAGSDDATAVANLKAVYHQWQMYHGPLHPSPLFGTLSREELNSGHLNHAALHLSFLLPQS